MKMLSLFTSCSSWLVDSQPTGHRRSEPGECRTSMPVDTDRTIWYIVGDNFNIQKPWSICVFSGKSLSDLRSLLSDDCSAVLCIRAGPYGKWTPLFTDLPDNKDTLEILVLDGESADAITLVYPRLDAPEA